jgi:hypothetical protein
MQTYLQNLFCMYKLGAKKLMQHGFTWSLFWRSLHILLMRSCLKRKLRELNTQLIANSYGPCSFGNLFCSYANKNTMFIIIFLWLIIHSSLCLCFSFHFHHLSSFYQLTLPYLPTKQQIINHIHHFTY